MTQAKIVDPVCDMVVDIAEARDQGLTLERPEREYAFCAAGCLATFAKAPHTYTPKVDAWLAADARREHAGAHDHSDELVIDQGIREWYKSCRCCLSDAYPKVVAQLDAERASLSLSPVSDGICETADGQQSRQ